MQSNSATFFSKPTPRVPYQLSSNTHNSPWQANSGWWCHVCRMHKCAHRSFHLAKRCRPCMYIPTMDDPGTSLTWVIQPGLLAAVAAQLLTCFRDDSNFKHPESKARDGIPVLTYISLVTSIFATTSSLALTVASINPQRCQRLSFFFMETAFKFCMTVLFELCQQ